GSRPRLPRTSRTSGAPYSRSCQIATPASHEREVDPEPLGQGPGNGTTQGGPRAGDVCPRGESRQGQAECAGGCGDRRADEGRGPDPQVDFRGDEARPADRVAGERVHDEPDDGGGQPRADD